MFRGLRVKVQRAENGRYLHATVLMGQGEYQLHYCIEKTDTAYGLYAAIFFSDVFLQNMPIIGFRTRDPEYRGGISDGLAVLPAKNMVVWEFSAPVTAILVAERARQVYRIAERELPSLDALLFLQRKLAHA